MLYIYIYIYRMYTHLVEDRCALKVLGAVDTHKLEKKQ